MKKTVFPLCLTLLVSCTTTTTNQNYKSYAVGVPRKTNVGDPMLIAEKITVVETTPWLEMWNNSKEATDDSFRQELIYTGRSGNTIHVAYREYKKDFARPAFFHELRYDLTQSELIVFRNYRIKVLDATTTHIRFVILTE